MKKFTLVLVLIILLLMNVASVTAADISSRSQELYPVSFNNRWGFVNGAGELVVAPQYSAARPFKDGMAAVYLNGKWGFVDSNGSLAVELQFDAVEDFSDGLAAVQKGWGNYGYIDKNGTYVIKPQFYLGYMSYPYFSHFRNGAAWAHINGGFYLIDKTGKPISKKYQWADPSSDDFTVVIGDNWKYGYVDSKGREVIKPQFDLARGFSEGLAVVVVGEKLGYIDKRGKIAIKPQFDAEIIRGYSGMFNDIPFVEGVAQVAINGERLFIDKSGKVVIKPKFKLDNKTGDYIENFSQGLAKVRLGYRWGFMDNSGSLVINAVYSSLGSYSEGLIAVPANGKWGYMDKNGKIVIEPRFMSAGDFKHGLANVSLQYGQFAGTSYIDTTGRLIWDPGSLYEPIKVFLNGNLLAFDSDPILDRGRTLVPFRAIGEALGATVEWEEKTRKVKLVLGEKTIELMIGDQKALINGQPTTLDVPPMIYYDRTMVPIRFISEAFGAKVDWDGEAKTVTISTVD